VFDSAITMDVVCAAVAKVSMSKGTPHMIKVDIKG
jgi:hypothetical protein